VGDAPGAGRPVACDRTWLRPRARRRLLPTALPGRGPRTRAAAPLARGRLEAAASAGGLRSAGCAVVGGGLFVGTSAPPTPSARRAPVPSRDRAAAGLLWRLPGVHRRASGGSTTAPGFLELFGTGGACRDSDLVPSRARTGMRACSSWPLQRTLCGSPVRCSATVDHWFAFLPSATHLGPAKSARQDPARTSGPGSRLTRRRPPWSFGRQPHPAGRRDSGGHPVVCGQGAGPAGPPRAAPAGRLLWGLEVGYGTSTWDATTGSLEPRGRGRRDLHGLEAVSAGEASGSIRACTPDRRAGRRCQPASHAGRLFT